MDVSLVKSSGCKFSQCGDVVFCLGEPLPAHRTRWMDHGKIVVVWKRIVVGEVEIQSDHFVRRVAETLNKKVAFKKEKFVLEEAVSSSREVIVDLIREIYGFHSRYYLKERKPHASLINDLPEHCVVSSARSCSRSRRHLSSLK